MKKLRLFVVLAVVLSLLGVASVPASAGKVKPPPGAKAKGNEKNKNKKKPPAPVPVPPGQAKKQAKGQGWEADTPDATPEPDDDPDAKEMICHKPGTPAEKTKLVPSWSIADHLGHGDRPGPCIELSPMAPLTPTETVTPTLTPTATVTPTFTWKIAICHKPATPAEKTLYLPQPAMRGHMGHGDYPGACIGATPTITPTETVTPTETATDEPTDEPTGEPSETPTAEAVGAVELLICHNPYAPDQETLMLVPSAVLGHLSHGDLPGSCDDLPPETWTRRLAAAFLRRLTSSY
ncbi:MAG TPA: hypothetical protein VLY63_14330 [Anaerolineae bacterium]|nr:hypothetical protein [Anaerolineae bacterium]